MKHMRYVPDLCVYCGKVYTKRNSTHKLCSDSCRRAHYRKESQLRLYGDSPPPSHTTKQCVHCGKDFTCTRRTAHKKYCSRACCNAVNNRKPKVGRWRLLRRDGFTCFYCGSKTIAGTPIQLTVDHIVPVVDGGTDRAENLVTSCVPCNVSKSGMRMDPADEVVALKTVARRNLEAGIEHYTEIKGTHVRPGNYKRKAEQDG